MEAILKTVDPEVAGWIADMIPLIDYQYRIVFKPHYGVSSKIFTVTRYNTFLKHGYEEDVDFIAYQGTQPGESDEFYVKNLSILVCLQLAEQENNTINMIIAIEERQ